MRCPAHGFDIGDCPICRDEKERQFAMAALTGMLSDQAYIGSNETTARLCYALADAMLNARKRTRRES